MLDKMRYEYSFLEPCNGPMGLVPSPGNESNDNLILFSVIAYFTFPNLTSAWIANVLGPRRLEPGKFCRHIGETFPSQHDDHLAVVWMGNGFAKEVYEYGLRSNWVWSDVRGLWANLRGYGIKGLWSRWLGRQLLFRYVTTLAARGYLLPHQWILLCVPYLLNAYEDRRKTSGKQLCWFSYQLLLRHAVKWYNPLFHVLKLWLWRMETMYPAGPYQMLRYYYWESEQYHGMVHPIALYAPRDWQ
jgi:hypothetical protein